MSPLVTSAGMRGVMLEVPPSALAVAVLAACVLLSSVAPEFVGEGLVVPAACSPFVSVVPDSVGEVVGCPVACSPPVSVTLESIG